MNQTDVENIVARAVLTVHHRNGGTAETLDRNLRLLDPALCLDSLDLAEIFASLERAFGSSPFMGSHPPVDWGGVIDYYAAPR